MVNFCPLSSLIFFIQFFLHFRKKTFCWAQRENIQTLSFIFLLLHLTKHTSKKFFFLFSLQNFPFTLFYFQTNTSLKFKLIWKNFFLTYYMKILKNFHIYYYNKLWLELMNTFINCHMSKILMNLKKIFYPPNNLGSCHRERWAPSGFI